MPNATLAEGDIQIGRVLADRYRIDALLGAGGMGAVYLAQHLGIGRAVAIKVLDTQVGSDPEARQRFEREALASGRLDHPNIVGVTDFGVFDDRRSFLVMEALTGESLGARIEREGALHWREAVAIAASMLRGLRHAHDRGVVHRDIKPDNVFLAVKDDVPTVKILDFGIAKLLDAGGDGSATTTRAGMTVGTPAYLSPEQAVGGEITPATDLYSATIVLFEMLTGHQPFDGEDLVSIMLSHVAKPPPLLRDLAPPDTEIPADLEVIVQRGLQKLAGDRIASADVYLALLDDLMRAPSGPMFSRESRPIAIPTTPEHAWLGSAATGHAPTVRATSLADVRAPIARGWWFVAGAVLFTMILLAITSNGRDHGVAPPADARAMDAAVSFDAARPPDAGVVAGDAGLVTGVPPSQGGDRSADVDAALQELVRGKTCAARRAAIPKLIELAAPRAIPALKAARYRMRGGILGFNETNTNACLTADAEAAIKTLGKVAK